MKKKYPALGEFVYLFDLPTCSAQLFVQCNAILDHTHYQNDDQAEVLMAWLEMYTLREHEALTVH